jgi:hypothetical protein
MCFTSLFLFCLFAMTHFDWPIIKEKKTLILRKLSKIEVSIGWWSAFPLAHHFIWGTQFKGSWGGWGVNGYHGEGLCYLLQNSMEIVWSMHTKWAPQNGMSQTIVQGTFWAFFWKVMNMNFGYVQWIVVPFIASPFESQLVLVNYLPFFFFFFLFFLALLLS